MDSLEKMRTVAQVAAVILLLGVLPWRGGSFHLRWFIYGLIILAAVVTYSLIYLFPARALRYSGDIAFVAAIVTFLLTPSSTTQREFYAVAAQVVPVLFLALAIDQRAFEVRSKMDESTRRFLTLPAGGLLLAGAEAFHALLDRPEKASLQLVMGGLVLGAVALFIRAVAGRSPR
jgi:hypothetical protein